MPINLTWKVAEHSLYNHIHIYFYVIILYCILFEDPNSQSLNQKQNLQLCHFWISDYIHACIFYNIYIFIWLIISISAFY